MVRLEHVNKYFNRRKKNEIHVINNTTLQMENKGLVALLGPSGCGKTTLLNVIGGLDKIGSGNIYINGEKLEENYGMEVIKPETIGRAAEPIELGDDEYFVMGDNRNNSSDSRTDMVGNIKRENIIGKAWLRIWPVSDFGVLQHQ